MGAASWEETGEVNGAVDDGPAAPAGACVVDVETAVVSKGTEKSNFKGEKDVESDDASSKGGSDCSFSACFAGSCAPVSGNARSCGRAFFWVLATGEMVTSSSLCFSDVDG